MNASEIARKHVNCLMQEAVLAWAEAGRPPEEFAVVLKTALLHEGPFSKSHLLGGRIENLQPMLEYIGSGSEGPGPPLLDTQPATTLDVACGLVPVEKHERLFAEALAFASEATRNELNAAVISIYAQVVLGLRRGKDVAIEEVLKNKTLEVRSHEMMERALADLLDERAFRFFLVLSSQSIGSIQFCSYGNGLHSLFFMEIIREWKKFCERVL